MTVAENICEGLASKELRAGVRGASRAAIKSWLLSKGHIKDGPSANNSVRKAINKLMETGMLIGVTNHRFKANVEKLDAEKKAKKDAIKKKNAAKMAKAKAAMAAKKDAKKKKMAAKKKKIAAAKATKKAKKAAKKAKKAPKKKAKKSKKVKKATKKKAKKTTKKKAKK